MDEMNYLDFDIHIHPSDEGYRVRIVNSPAGQADAEFSLPFSELELENFKLRIGRTRKGVRRLESPEMEAARQFGGSLFEAVFSDEIRGHLRTSINEANQQDAGLRFRLHLADTPELADLPWEYLYDSTLDEFLVLSVQTPIVRYLDLPIKTTPLTTTLPLKVLVMISSPSDFPELDVEQEYETLSNGLIGLQQRGLVSLERLEQATLATLQRQLRKDEYHIFHFIGHGGYDKNAEDGVLVLEDENGRGREVSGRYLGTMLHDQKTLRLAVLNACEGAITSSSDPFSGVAHSLVQKGIPAVIAMQNEITDEAAIVLANEFYGAIADGYPVDASLAEARKAVFAQNNDIEWGTPVLYMRSPDGRIFGVDRSTLPTGALAGTGAQDLQPAGEATLRSATLAAGMAAEPAVQAGVPPTQVGAGGEGGGTIVPPAAHGTAAYPPRRKRSILPWLIAFIGVAALIVTTLIFLEVIDLGAIIGSGGKPAPIAAVSTTQTPTETIPPTDTPAPTDTEQPAQTTEEVVIPDTGPSSTPTETLTPEPTPTEEPTPTLGPTPIGGGPGTIAFASNREGNFQIWVSDVDGNNATKITNMPGGACQPAWSPDGNQLVYISPCTRDQEWYENSALYVINLGGGPERKLTGGINGDYDPSWAPSELILFTSRESNQPNLYTIDPVAGGALKPLTQHSWNYRGDWSADGLSIAFVSTRLSPVPKVFTMPALGELESGGGQAKEFSRGQEFAYNQPRYSPDGQFMLFRKTAPNTSSPAELAGSKLEDIGLKESSIGSYQSIGPFNDADYSPDGKWIVFEGWPDGEHNIYMMTANGSNVRQVTTGGSFNFDPAWRPILEP